MKSTQLTQRIVDAAHLILWSAAIRTEQTRCTTTQAFVWGEDRAAETYQLGRQELANAARIATTAAFAAGAYAINAMACPEIRTAALQAAIPHIIRDQPRDHPCSTESEECSREAHSHIPTRNSNRSAKHSIDTTSAWRRFVNYLSKALTSSTKRQPGSDPTMTTTT